MKIYTKTGDKGTTGLFGGSRVSKSNIRIDAYGTIDELNSHIGLLRDQEVNSGRQNILIQIQEQLFTIGSMLATEDESKAAGIPTTREEDIKVLEVAIDQMEETLEPMRNFVLPGGHASVSICHIARCVCRRAERRVVYLGESEKVEEIVIHYLNRLSDYLFVLSRKMTAELGAKETPWKPRG
jgi:cob(I)alamin adenosyltransferase